MDDLTLQFDQLEEGEVKTLHCSVSPSFLDLGSHDEVQAEKEVVCHIKASLVTGFLLIEAQVETELMIPCSFCNERFATPIHIEGHIFQEELSAIKGDSFCLEPLIREEILLEIPHYALCGGRDCSNRATIEKYVKNQEENSYRPFENLDIE